MVGLLSWFAGIMGFGSETFPYPAQVRFVGALSSLGVIASLVMGTYLFFRKAFGSLDDFDGPAATSFAAVAAVSAVVFAAFLLASRRSS